MFWSAFQLKYHTKSLKKLPAIVKSKRWQVVDIRPKEEWIESHVLTSTNIPHYLFKLLYHRRIQRKQRILLISQTGRSHLNLYRLLKKHHIKVHILNGGWHAIHNNPKVDKYITYCPMD